MASDKGEIQNRYKGFCIIYYYIIIVLFIYFYICFFYDVKMDSRLYEVDFVSAVNCGVAKSVIILDHILDRA